MKHLKSLIYCYFDGMLPMTYLPLHSQKLLTLTRKNLISEMPEVIAAQKQLQSN
jgi:hypothetical protein